ncbi:TRAM/LAG1/CLN8 homology domain-containing protein [Dioscorea alata]|uniref:TRAM/LAG1/CLN8 homology domain-containing protein n=1 Tax=Dioscorea alata TaxID=55571 RepID=A0ACB7UUI6_DIOAL|nr:TRAM/LAG1/CLN8 homology domain-containing protein [Dioscorea alata]
MEEDPSVSFVVLGIISWSIIFIFIRRTLPNFSFDFCSRLVATMHASLALCLASLSVQDWSCPVCPQASSSSPSQKRTLAVTLSYLIYDLGCCFMNKQLPLDTLFHHLVSITGIGACLLYGTSGAELVAALWVTEISTPFLHLRELIKELGFKDTDLNLAVDLLFATFFTLGRMVGGPYVTHSTWAANNPILIKVMAMGLQLVSVFWFYKILNMVKHKLLKRVSAKKKP